MVAILSDIIRMSKQDNAKGLIGVFMNRSRIVSILALLFLLLIGNPLFAATLVATYTEELDTTIVTSASFGIGEPNYSLAFHVGTLTIQKVGTGSIRDYKGLTLTQSGFLNNPLRLTSNRTINGMSTFNAKMVAKVIRNSTSTKVPISQVQGEISLISKNTSLSDYPITVEFYVLIAGIATPELVAGAHFQFANPPGGDLGKYTLMTTYLFFWFIPINESIEVNNSSASIPYLIDYTSGSPNFININSVDPTVYASLEIEQALSQASISLSQAAGTNKAKVGVARITLGGFEGAGAFGVSISFTDGNGSTTDRFLLKHSDLNQYIPFDIKLADQPVKNSIPLDWKNLSYGRGNTKDLHITGIDYATAQTSISGLYSDIIYVNITPLDTNLVGL